MIRTISNWMSGKFDCLVYNLIMFNTAVCRAPVQGCSFIHAGSHIIWPLQVSELSRVKAWIHVSMLLCSAALAWSHSLVSLVGGPLILFLHRWDEHQDRCRRLHCIFPLANASLPRSSFLWHLTERLVSFSPRAFVQMWAARTLWHAWGLPMRLDGDSDTAAAAKWSPKLQVGAGEGMISAVHMSHRGPVCSHELLYRSPAFSFGVKSATSSFKLATVRCKEPISLVPYFGKYTCRQIRMGENKHHFWYSPTDR